MHLPPEGHELVQVDDAVVVLVGQRKQPLDRPVLQRLALVLAEGVHDDVKVLRSHHAVAVEVVLQEGGRGRVHLLRAQPGEAVDRAAALNAGAHGLVVLAAAERRGQRGLTACALRRLRACPALLRLLRRAC
eukprot:7382067-Prymnesium_polylepis.1